MYRITPVGYVDCCFNLTGSTSRISIRDLVIETQDDGYFHTAFRFSGTHRYIAVENCLWHTQRLLVCDSSSTLDKSRILACSNISSATVSPLVPSVLVRGSTLLGASEISQNRGISFESSGGHGWKITNNTISGSITLGASTTRSVIYGNSRGAANPVITSYTITTSASSGLNILGLNTGAGTKTIHATDIDLDELTPTNLDGYALTSLSNLTTTAINKDLLPDSDDVRRLGSPSLRWADGYFGPSSLHLMSTAAETTTARDWSLGIAEAAGTSQGRFRLMQQASEYLCVDATGRVGIGTNATTPDDLVTVALNQNATTALKVRNESSGGTAFSSLTLSTGDSASRYAVYGVTGSGFTTVGLAVAAQFHMTSHSGCTAGMLVKTEAASAPIVLSVPTSANQGTNAASERLRVGGSEVVLNDNGQNVDTRIESDNRTHMIFVDANAGNASHLGRVGINRSSLSATLDIDNGASAEPPLIVRDNGTAVVTIADGGDVVFASSIATTPSSTTINAAGATLTVGSTSFIKLTLGASATGNITLSDGVQDGQHLVIKCVSNAGTAIIPDNTAQNVKLSADWNPTADDTLSLIWDSTDSNWTEMARSTN